MLCILEEKGFLKHREDGRRYVYLPTEPREEASRSALQGVVKTFFAGAAALASLIPEPLTHTIPANPAKARHSHRFLFMILLL